MAGVQIDGVNNKIDFDDDQDTSISSASDDTLVFEIAGATDFTMTANTFTAASGSTIAAQALTATTGTFASNVTVSTADNTDTLKLVSTDADANSGPVLVLHRDSGSPADADSIGIINFAADSDAASETDFAIIKAFSSDVSHGSESGQLTISTRLSGTEKQRITMGTAATVFNDDSADLDFRVESNNKTHMMSVDAGDDRTHFGSTSHQGMSLGVHNFYSGTTTDQSAMTIGSNTASYGNNLFKIGCLRDQTSSYSFITCFTGNGSDDLDDDLEFRVKGDGNVTCDESFTGSGADYAEYFEWKDGNASDEDRIGISVKLDGNKIVPSSDSDDASVIIGVISATPVVVGDADGTGTRWTQKYLQDDYGRNITEEYTVTEWIEKATNEDEENKEHSYATDRIPSDVTVPSDAKVTTTETDGVTKLTRRKINPDYDSTKTYVAREDRKEWDTVGLVGKLRIKKGQKTGTNWIKMRDISDTVEEWLVR
jgi:hypothetical protein